MRRLWLGAWLVACSSNPSMPPPSVDAPPASTSIMLTPSTISAKADMTPPTQLDATLLVDNVSGEDITPDATYTSSDPTVATVDDLGRVTAVGEGSATITATFDGATGSATIASTAPTMIVSCAVSRQLLLYDAFATGATPPLRTISGGTAAPGFAWWELAGDGSNVYVADSAANAVYGFALDTGAPTIAISGSNTQLNQPYGVAVANGEIYVGLAGSIAVFRTTDTGNVAPERVITSDALPANEPVYALAISDDVLYASPTSADDLNVTPIVLFPAAASGPTTPIRTLSVFPLEEATGLTVRNGEIFAADDVQAAVDVVLAGSGSGLQEVGPIRRIEGADTSYNPLAQLQVLGDRLYVVRYDSPAVIATNAEATSDTPALSVLDLPCDNPRGLWFY